MAKIDLGLVRGSLWYQGTKLTGQSTTGVVFPESGISEAMKGDKYQNSETNDLYDCIKGGAADIAQWAWYGNISFGDISDRPVNYTLPETIDMTQIPTSGGLLKDFIGWIFKSISSLNSAMEIFDLAIIRKQVSGNTFTITVSDDNNLREPVLVLIGAQAHRQEGAAIFTPCGISFSSLGGTISMSKSENIWTVTGSDAGYGVALIIGSKRMISMLG